MRKVIVLLFLFVSVSVFSMACSDDAGQPLDGEDATQEDILDQADVLGEGDVADGVEDSEYRAEYSEPYAQAVCARIFSCCPFRDRDRAAELMGIQVDFDTQEACVVALSDVVDAKLQDDTTIESLATERRRYRADKVDDCIEEIEVASCGGGLLSVEAERACAQVFEGQVEEGEDCTVDEDCQEGYCTEQEQDEDGNIIELGICQSPAPGQLGGECNMSGLLSQSLCVEGGTCNPETFICQQSVELGQSCEQSWECVAGSYCDETCKVRKTLGDACIPGACDAHTYCEMPGIGESGEAKCEARKGVGEVCDADTAESQCKAGSLCSGGDVTRCSDFRNTTQVCLGIE